jgi:hypothetical protein
MLTDDQLAESIGDRLHAEVADITPPPDLLSTLHRRQARRVWVVRGAAASSLAATAGVIALVLAGAGPPSASTAGGGTPTAAASSRVETVAFVTEQATAALARSDQFVEETDTTDNAGYHTVFWSDTAGKRDRSSFDFKGQPASDTATSTASGTTTVLVVDHPSRSWWTYQTDARPPKRFGKEILNLSDPDGIRDAIADGGLKLLGHDQTDGRDTLHVRLDVRIRKQVDTYVDMWVDAASYLPVKSVLTSPDYSATTTYTWLPRTANNLANLDLVPPAGYTHRAGPPDGPPQGGKPVG